MNSMVVWIVTIGASTAALVYAAGASLHYAHLAIGALTALVLAYAGHYESNRAVKSGASASAIAGITARQMGLVWAWGALVLVSTYAFVLQWKEWWQFFLAFAAAAGLCLFFSVVLRKDAEGRGEDETMLKAARYLSIGQLVGMIATMIGLLIDGKMTRFMNPRYTDWAGNHVFFFGAAALAIISFISMRAAGKASGQSTGAT